MAVNLLPIATRLLSHLSRTFLSCLGTYLHAAISNFFSVSESCIRTIIPNMSPPGVPDNQIPNFEEEANGYKTGIKRNLKKVKLFYNTDKDPQASRIIVSYPAMLGDRIYHPSNGSI